jgi:hypothetical protein
MAIEVKGIEKLNCFRLAGSILRENPRNGSKSLLQLLWTSRP